MFAWVPKVLATKLHREIGTFWGPTGLATAAVGLGLHLFGALMLLQASMVFYWKAFIGVAIVAAVGFVFASVGAYVVPMAVSRVLDIPCTAEEAKAAKSS